MNILILQTWIRQGGAENQSIGIAHHLQELGYRVRIATLFADLRAAPPIAQEVKYLTPPGSLSRLFQRSRPLLFLLGTPTLLWMALKHSKGVDVLDCHNPPSPWVGALVGKLQGKSVVWTCNEPPERISRDQARKVGLLEFFIRLLAASWLDRWLMEGMDHILVLSEKTRSEVKTRYRKEATVVRVGIDYPFFARGDGGHLRQEHGLENKYVLLTVGKLHPQKNQVLCLEALERIVPSIPSAVLVVIGEGPMESLLRRKAEEFGLSERVIFTGFVPSEELRDWYHACDLVLFPARNQSWGNVPFEALCARKISIVSNDSGAAEVLRRRNIGVVSEPTRETFANKILQVHGDRKRFERMAEAGARYVREELTWSNRVLDTLAIYERAVKGRGSVEALERG